MRPFTLLVLPRAKLSLRSGGRGTARPAGFPGAAAFASWARLGGLGTLCVPAPAFAVGTPLGECEEFTLCCAGEAAFPLAIGDWFPLKPAGRAGGVMWVTTLRFVAEAGGMPRVAGVCPPRTDCLVGDTSAPLTSCPLPSADFGTTVPTRLIAAPEVNADLGAAVTAPAALRKP